MKLTPSAVSFEALRTKLKSPYQGKTVFDGEIVCLDKRGQPQFRDLLFHRGVPSFFAFDMLMVDGDDLRSERLIDRKHELRRIMSKIESEMQYVEHIEEHGTALFQRVCKMDLEGIVAKHSLAPYTRQSARRGSRSRIPNTHRWRVAKNYLKNQ